MYIKFKKAAAIQKGIAYGIVILSAGSERGILVIILGCIIGMFLSEMADVMYKLTIKYEKAIEKSA